MPLKYQERHITWKEFKDAVEAKGATDNTLVSVIDFFDVDTVDELEIRVNDYDGAGGTVLYISQEL
jgi:hypothetical protein